jgi:ATP-dependent Clp protease ATP-binding subunit ClpC
MLENVDQDARDVMELAVCETGRFNHEYLGTEHILLGLVKGAGRGVEILKDLNVDLWKIRSEIERIIQSGSDFPTTGRLPIPFTPRAKESLENALDEARLLNRKTVSTEHILLGLLRDTQSVANLVLTQSGVKIDDVRRRVRDLAPE